MSEIRWVKISTAMFDDEKIRVIESMPCGGDVCLIWIKLIVLAGRINDNGLVYLSKNLPYTDDMLAHIFSKPVETIRVALQTFQQLGMIEISGDKVILLTNWDKYQNIDGMDKIRKLGRERVQKFRERQKLIACNVTGNATVTECNAIELELDKELEEKTSAPKRNTASAPKIVFDFTTKKWTNIDDETVELWSHAYPAVDVEVELGKMAAWLLANPAKRKKNYAHFINNWLNRTQDKGGTR